MKNNLPTEAGQTSSSDNMSKSKKANADIHNAEKVDAINQVFALFKLNYHNQFYKAFTQSNDLNSTKRLWLESLAHFSPETLLRAAKAVMQTSEFLPTLHTMLKHCEQQSINGLPQVHAAYLEACRAPSPKAEFSWSHPAVYHAGKNVDWYFLQSNAENVAFPVFKQAYQELCQQVMLGEKLDIPSIKKLPSENNEIADKNLSKKHIDSLKSMFNEES